MHNHKKITWVLLLIAFCLLSKPLAAQVPEDDTTDYVLVELVSGEEIYGNLQSQSSEKITLRTNDGQVRIIPFKLVKSLKRVNVALPARNVNFYNVQADRYFISGNAIGLKKGEGYYRNVWVLFNEASYGVTDFFSISGGLIPTFFFGIPSVPFWVSPKVNFALKEDVVYVGAGALIGGLAGLNFGSGLVGLGYGNVTVGNRDANLTVSGGFLFAEGEAQQIPAFGVSGMLRVSPKFYLLSENYIVEDASFFSIGGRTVWSSLSLDYGLFSPMGAEVILPWLGIMVPFE